jgi:hypothetical protein
MPYIINKTNGTIVATVQDASLDTTTDLTFVGRNYAGYGEVQNENFLKLLENFADTSAPIKPIDGQLWFDTANKRINSYDGKSWKSIANLEIASDNPGTATKVFEQGDLWFDSTEEQLYVYNGSDFILVGPPTGADTRAQWRGSFEYNISESRIPKYNIKAVVGATNEVIAIVSSDTYTLDPENISSSYPIYPTTTKVVKGITLNGADAETGSSEEVGVYFWGTARHASVANTATVAINLDTSVIATNAQFDVPFKNTNGLYTSTGFKYNPSTDTLTADFFDGIATSAYYADLAERYEADAEYEPGTVVIIGGEKEVTITDRYADTRVAGVVSTNPAFLMNKDAGTDKTHPAIALKGRVPCKVVGTIRKGDLLVTSKYPGYAASCNGRPDVGTVIGKALANQDQGFGVIEILVI